MATQKNLKLYLKRTYKKDEYTIGDFFIDGKWFSASLEDKDRELTQDMDLSVIQAKKKYGETAIPSGTYEVRFTYSPKFAKRAWAKPYNGKVPEIIGVKGFEGIRIHPFNKAEESLGCIGLGLNLEKGKVLYSTKYYTKLLDCYLIPAINKGMKVTITIK